MIIFKEKQYSTPVGRGIYRVVRALPGQTHMSAGRKAIKAKRVLNDQAKVVAKNPVSATIGTVAIPLPGGTIISANSIGRHLETPVLARVAPNYGKGVDRFVNKMV